MGYAKRAFESRQRIFKFTIHHTEFVAIVILLNTEGDIYVKFVL